LDAQASCYPLSERYVRWFGGRFAHLLIQMFNDSEA